MLDILVFVALSAIAEEKTTVRSLMREAGQAIVTESGMTVVRVPQTHVLVARVTDDGAVSTTCTTQVETVETLLVEKKVEHR